MSEIDEIRSYIRNELKTVHKAAPSFPRHIYNGGILTKQKDRLVMLDTTFVKFLPYSRSDGFNSCQLIALRSTASFILCCVTVSFEFPVFTSMK